MMASVIITLICNFGFKRRRFMAQSQLPHCGITHCVPKVDTVRDPAERRKGGLTRGGRSPNWIKAKNRSHQAMDRVNVSF